MSLKAPKTIILNIGSELLRGTTFNSNATKNMLLENAVGIILRKFNRTLGVAESITGGMIGERITSVPGSSRYFSGAIVAYANSVKENLLKVDPTVLKKYGAVSKQTAVAMAIGVRDCLNTDYGVSVTGMAWPTGKTQKKPIGLVHSAVAFRNHVYHRQFQFRGDRPRIKQATCTAALGFLYDILRKEE